MRSWTDGETLQGVSASKRILAAGRLSDIISGGTGLRKVP